MVDQNELNELYKASYENALKISLKLNDLGYKNRISFCNKNYELVGTEWQCNYFPIPVIELKGIDLNLDLFDKPYYFELFLSPRQIKTFDFKKLLFKFSKHKLSIYDGIDCLQDLYTRGMTADELAKTIKVLKPKQIGISFETSRSIKNITSDLRELLNCYQEKE